MRFKDLSVSNKLIGIFGCVLIITAGLGLFAVNSLTTLNTASGGVRDNALPSISHLGRFEYLVTRYRVAQANLVMATTEEQRSSMRQLTQSYLAQIDEAWNKYQQLSADADETALSEKITTARAVYHSMQAKAEEIAKEQGQAAAIAYFMGPMKTAFGAVVEAIDADVDLNNQSGKAAGDKIEQTFESARVLIFVVLGIAILLCLGACILLVRTISTPLRAMTSAMGELARGNLDTHVPHSDQSDEIGQLAETMTAFKNQLSAAEKAKVEQAQLIVSSIGTGLDHLAKGDLTHRIVAELTGVFAKLKGDFNSAMAHLQDTMKNVLGSTNQISTGADEISQAADDLSRRTEQQAASLEETAAALEEITATVKKTASNAREASQSVADAKVAAEDGGRVVGTAITAMDAISQSSKQITDIIAVIDEIAFQTNLLALNAGVEAARAGDAGRGFAVVASEVRSLAQRSSDAAKQIKTLIKTSGEHVESGVKYVGDSGLALKRIVDQVLTINALVSEMAQAAEQQSTGIEQVNAAVSQMDQVTQQNAAMVEESTAASRNLAGETQVLANLVDFFSVGTVARTAAPRIQTTSSPAATMKKPQLRPVPPARSTASGGKQRTAVARAPAPQPDVEWSEF